MLQYIQTNYDFTCKCCNMKYQVFKENSTTNKFIMNSCKDFVNLSINEFPKELKNLFNNSCEFLYFLYYTKKNFTMEEFIDPFEFTYFYTKELAKATGLNLTLNYNQLYDSSEDDYIIFKQFLDHFYHINSLKSIE